MKMTRILMTILGWILLRIYIPAIWVIFGIFYAVFSIPVFLLEILEIVIRKLEDPGEPLLKGRER